jgi:hypothetical protein
VTLSANGAFVRARFDSTRLEGAGRAFPDPSNAAARFVATLSREDFGANAARVSGRGVIRPPLH